MKLVMISWRIRLAALAGAITVLSGLLLVPWHGSSQSLNGNVSIQKIERHLSESGSAMVIDNITEIMRPDGSRAITNVRTYKSTQNPMGWETREVRTLYNARENVVHEIMPALKMYGSLPIGREKYAPLKPMSTCKGPVPTVGKILSMSKGEQFGKQVERYIVEVASDIDTKLWVMHITAFPELGCLVGDKVTELWNKQNNDLLAKKITEVVALSVVPDDPSLFLNPPADFVSAKPSEILVNDYEIMKKTCPECVTSGGQYADERYQRLWDERRAGKR